MPLEPVDRLTEIKRRMKSEQYLPSDVHYLVREVDALRAMHTELHDSLLLLLEKLGEGE